MKIIKRLIFVLCFVGHISQSEGKVISRDLDSLTQVCDQPSFEAQRIDVFTGDDVDMVCACHESSQAAQNRQGMKFTDGVVTDKSNYLDMTTWTYAKSFSPIKETYFALHRNKEWEELMSEEDDEVQTKGGNAESRPCAFPFYYSDPPNNQKKSYSCQPSGRSDNTCWCSPTRNFNADKLWGFCPCASPRRGFRIVTEGGTDPGKVCHFPFRYSGTEHVDCIYEGRGRCWCGTTYNVDVDNQWGFCPCASSTIKGQWGAWTVWTPCKCGEIKFRSRPCNTIHQDIPAGRGVACDGGFSVNVALCGCFQDDEIDLKHHLEDIKNRTSVMIPNRRRPHPRLKLENLTKSDSGWYICWKGNVVKKHGNIDQRLKQIVVYELNVIDFDDIHLVLYHDKEHVPYGTSRYSSDMLVWIWTFWQACDRCGVITGEKKKFGFCFTREPDNSRVLGRLAPCRSPMMDAAKRSRMKKFSNYMVVFTCKVKCHRSREKYIIVPVNKVEGLPTSRPPAFRAIYHATAGETIRLKCPGSDPLLPVTWQFEEKTLHAEIQPLLRHKQHSRLSHHDGTIGMNGDLVLNKITIMSNGYFSCFVNRTLAASYSIIVDNSLLQKLRNLLDSTIYIIIILVAVVFASVAYSIIKLERKAVAAY